MRRPRDAGDAPVRRRSRPAGADANEGAGARLPLLPRPRPAGGCA
jgi:hypothetical protein